MYYPKKVYIMIDSIKKLIEKKKNNKTIICTEYDIKYNGYPLKLSDIRLYSPGLHTFNEKHSDAEEKFWHNHLPDCAGSAFDWPARLDDSVGIC